MPKWGVETHLGQMVCDNTNTEAFSFASYFTNIRHDFHQNAIYQ